MDESEIEELPTEQVADDVEGIQYMDISEILELVGVRHERLFEAFENVESELVKAIELMTDAEKWYFVGAGTSGRLGVLQAAEIPPTFNSDIATAYIAGGLEAVYRSVRGAEDDINAGRGLDFKEGSVVVGITASGRTPYVLGAMEAAQDCSRVAVTCNKKGDIGELVDVHLALDIGPNLIGGSTRWFPATAQKMVLDVLSSAAMIRKGRVEDGYMVGLNPDTVAKTRARARVIENNGYEIKK